jgi:hypothetical protein
MHRSNTGPAQRRNNETQPRTGRGEKAIKADWTVNQGFPGTNVLHPNHDKNKQEFQALLDGEKTATPDSLVPEILFQRFAKREVREITLITPNGEHLTQEQCLIDQKGFPVRDMPQALWSTGDWCGTIYGTQNTNDKKSFGSPIEYAEGSGVLEPMPGTEEFYERAARELYNLDLKTLKSPLIGFSNPTKNSTDKRFHGYNPQKRGPKGGRNFKATIADVFSYLSPYLKDFVMAYCKGIAKVIGVPYDSIPTWTLIFVVYPTGHGFRFHIDGITDFGDYPGPVFNLSLNIMRNGDVPITPKYFDIIELNFDKPETEPRGTRVVLRPVGDTHFMSSYARATCAHGVPDSYIRHRDGSKTIPDSIADMIMMTLSIKCPELTIARKRAWVKEVPISFLGFQFDKLILHIDAKEGLKSTLKHIATLSKREKKAALSDKPSKE